MSDNRLNHLCMTLLLGALAGLPAMGLALTPFPQDGLWGYVDSNGAFIIEPQYARASAFNEEGFAIVEVSRPEGKGYWLSRERADTESVYAMTGPPRDAAHQQTEGLELALGWQEEYASGPMDLFELVHTHGDSSGIFAFNEQLHNDPVLLRQFLTNLDSDNDSGTADNPDSRPLEEVTYNILNREGEIIHEFHQKGWVQHLVPKGSILYYEETLESDDESVTMVSLNLRTMEQARIPQEDRVWAHPFGEHLMLFSPSKLFLHFAQQVGEDVNPDVEFPPSRIVDSKGDTLFQDPGLTMVLASSDSVFEIMEDDKWHFARLPDGIFAGPYERCLGFTDQRGLVLLDRNTYSYVDEKGTLLSESGVAYATIFHDGHAVIRRHGSPRWEVIRTDLATQAVIEGVDEVLRPTVGAIPFRRGEKWGYLNLDGTKKIPAQFDAVGDFEDGVALALNETTFILINEAGERLRESTLPSYAMPELPPFPGPDPFEMRHDPNEPFGRDPFGEQ